LRIAIETWREDLGMGEISPMATGTLVLEYIMIFWGKAVYESISWVVEMVRNEFVSVEGMFQTLEVEVTLMQEKSTMATLVRNYIRISWGELVYEFVSSGEETSKTLGVEEMLLKEQSTMATWNLVGRNKSISWVVEIVRNLGVVIAKALGW
jgi:hypothetical protein